jgi:hypothetical protein
MAITRTPMIDDDGTGNVGTILNDAWKQELYDQIDGAVAATTTTTSAPSLPALTALIETAVAQPAAPDHARLIDALRRLLAADHTT